jgi:hypothetical protein
MKKKLLEFFFSLYDHPDYYDDQEIMDYLKSKGYTEEKIEKQKQKLLKKIDELFEEKLENSQNQTKKNYIIAAREQSGELDITDEEKRILEELKKKKNNK